MTSTTTKVLQPATLGRCEVPNPNLLAKERLTGVAVLCHEKSRLLLVQTQKGGNWICPQGGFKRQDGTIDGTVRRECRDDLGLESRHLADYGIILGQCHNEKGKLLVPVVIPVMQRAPIRLSSEHTSYTWVSSTEDFERLVMPTAHEHPIKTWALLDVVVAMISNRLLWWHMPKHVAHPLAA